MTFAKKPVKITKKKVKTDVRGNPLPVPHGPTRVNPLAPNKVIPGKPGVPAKLAPKPKAPTPQDVGIPGVHPHHAAARSTQLPGAVVKPIAHPGKLKGKTPIDQETGKGVKVPPPIPAGDEPGMDVVQDEVNPPFDPADEYKVMGEWFASAGWAGVPKLKPGDPLPEWDDGEDD